MYTKALLVAALASVATAQLPAAVAKRDHLEARQTASLSPDCQAAVASVLPLYSQLPTPAAGLLTATLPTDPCATPTFTGSLSSEWASYTSAALGWYSSHSAELLSALASCTDLLQYASGVPVCSSIAGGAGATTGGSGSATTTRSGSASTGTAASGSAASGTASPTKNFAARETGMIGAAVAAAGLVAAVL